MSGTDLAERTEVERSTAAPHDLGGITPGGSEEITEGPQQNFDPKEAEDEYRQVHLRKEHGLFRRIWNLFRRNKSKEVEDNLKNALNEGNLDEAKDMFRKDVAADIMYAHQTENEVPREPQPPVNGVQRHPQTPPMR